MSSTPHFDPSLPPAEDAFETRLVETARAFPYPVTPDLRRSAVRRRAGARPSRAWVTAAGLVLALILAAVLAVPPVRAAVLDWVRIGAVRIFLVQPSPTPQPPPTARPGTPTPADTLTPQPTPTPLRSVLDLSGETSLAEAQAQVTFPIRLPTDPADLGQPDHVYYQTMVGPVIVLAWMDPDHPGTVRMSLSETASDQVIFQKFQANSIQDTQVNGQPAIWVDGNYLLVTGNGETQLTRLVDQGHTLIWTVENITYRLETGADLASAIRTAESMR